jgi:hypothetical protein
MRSVTHRPGEIAGKERVMNMPARGPRKAARSADPGLYTYRDGHRVPLVKRPDEFVIRASPQAATDAGLKVVEKVSPHSTRVSTPPAQLDAAMARPAPSRRRITPMTPPETGQVP